MENTRQKEVREFRPVATLPIANALRSQSVSEQGNHGNKDEG